MSDDPLADVAARIARDPDDDAARLDAAALFDAADPPRAEHVRLGVEVGRALLDHFLAAPGSPDYPRLPQWTQLAAIEKEHSPRWTAPLSFLDEPGSVHPACCFDRGFVHSVNVRADVLLDRADELALHPIETLNVRTPLRGAVPLHRVLSLPIMRRVGALFLLDQQLRSAEYEALAACETLDQCQLLFLPFRTIADHDLARLAASPRLRSLHVHGGGHMQRDATTQDPTRYWQSAMAADLEATYGPMSWFRPTLPADAYYAGHGLRVLRRLKAAGAPDFTVTAAPLGAFRTLSYDGLAGGDYSNATRILDAKGYREGGQGRLRYGVSKDGAAGWGGWTYWLDVEEYSDAPVADELDRALRWPPHPAMTPSSR